MKVFFKNIVLFLLISIVVGEIFIRTLHVMADIPRRIIDDSGIQKYYPNQTGHWEGRNHKWHINSLGWPGELPDSYDNLIAIIGDSYIENFMNPKECHQAVFLKKEMPNHNFIEAARSGVSLIESMEISKKIDTLNPRVILIHTGGNDIFESIQEIKTESNFVQLNTKEKIIVPGKLKSPGMKKVLYSCKLLYYFYNKFFQGFKGKSAKIPQKNKFELHESKIRLLITYIKENYNIDNKVFVFKPNSNKNIINIFKAMGFNIILLDASEDKSWTFDFDSHWTCYGHERVALQVKLGLENNFQNLIK